MLTGKWNFDGKGFVEAAVAAAKKGVEERILSVRCPVHGSSATSVAVTDGDGEFKFTFGACCDELRSAIAASFRQE